MSPSDHDTDPAPVKEDDPPSAFRRLLTKILNGLADHSDKVIMAAMGLVLSILLRWTQRIDETADHAQAVAGVASAQAATVTQVAVTAKTETNTAYDVTTNKQISTVEDLKQLVKRVNDLESEVERLRARDGRVRRKRKPITLSPATTEPPPPSPAAAVEEAKEVSP